MENSVKYSKKVMQHFMHPKNAGRIENADGVGKVGNPICGDIMKVYIKVGNAKKSKISGTSKTKGFRGNKKGEKIIKDIKFETMGCAAAIATSSMVTEIAKGKTLKEAMKLTKNEVADELGGLPPIKMHCSNLASDALHAAIKNYLKKK